jgi:hypothetical protein
MMDKFELICITLFLFMVGTSYKMPVKDVPNCFPDYRPYFKCFVFEKLP